MILKKAKIQAILAIEMHNKKRISSKVLYKNPDKKQKKECKNYVKNAKIWAILDIEMLNCMLKVQNSYVKKYTKKRKLFFLI